MAEKVKGGVIKAAGGLVWLEDFGDRKIALVHRTRYGGEWTLPKGKLNADEDWKEAALREVSEEIGVPKNEVEVGSVAGIISYFVEGTPKIVVFYNMFCKKECKVVKKEKTRTEVDSKSGEKKETKPVVDDKSKEKPESEDEVDKVELIPVYEPLLSSGFPNDKSNECKYG